MPFDIFVDKVEDALAHHEIIVVDQEFAVSKDHNRLFGAMHIRAAETYSDEWDLILGLRGSHDGKFARGLTLGTKVIVCSNLCFGGELGTFKTKQTTHIMDRLPGMIESAVKRIPDAADTQRAAFEIYKAHDLEDPRADAILLEMWRQKVLSTPQLARSLHEWDKPTHDYGKNVYTLFNGCTEAMKPTGQTFSPELHMERTLKLTHELDSVVGL